MDNTEPKSGVMKKEGLGSPSPVGLSDFSIEHILKSAGTKKRIVSEDALVTSVVPRVLEPSGVLSEGLIPTEQQQLNRFEWLQCTRYHPPKLPRSRRKDSSSKEGVQGKTVSQQPQQRRKLGRNPRIPFSSSQVSALEQRFRRGHYLSSADVAALSSCLRLSETRVKIWFQNRRARERRDREARAAKTNESATSCKDTVEMTLPYNTPPVTQPLPSISDSSAIEHRMRPSVAPTITTSVPHLFEFHSPRLFPISSSPITFPRASQGLTSAFVPISPHLLAQPPSLVGGPAIPRTFMAAQHKIVSNSTI